jgi:hypothetical protein
VLKSLGLLGLGRERAARVPVDRQGRIRVEALPEVAGRPSRACRRVTSIPARSTLWRTSAAGPGAGAWMHVDGALEAILRIAATT